LIAALGGYSRTDVDAFAMRSHQKAATAWERGSFTQSVIPVVDRNGLSILDRDETIRADSTIETLGKLKASFQMMGEMGFDGVARERYPQIETINHIHSPGNSSGIVDGAAALLIGSELAGNKFGMKPRARVASVVRRFMDEMGVSEDVVNVNGGSIAMGHPLGATGAMILGTLLDELEARDLKTGLATLCVGGGMGIATIIERV